MADEPTAIPLAITYRSKQELIYAMLLSALGYGSPVIGPIPLEIEHRSEQELLYALKKAIDDLVAGGGGGGASWGAITGMLSAQIDLQSALDAKVAKVTSTDNAFARFNGTTGDIQNSLGLLDDSGNAKLKSVMFLDALGAGAGFLGNSLGATFDIYGGSQWAFGNAFGGQLFQGGAGSKVTWGAAGPISAPSLAVGYIAPSVFGLGFYSGATGGILECEQVLTGGIPSANSVRFFGMDVLGTAQAFAADETGNAVQLTAHNRTGPDWLYNGTPGEQVGFSFNSFTGLVKYTNTDRVRQGRMDSIFIETFDQHNERLGLTGDTAKTQLNWGDEQTKKVVYSEQAISDWHARKDQAAADLEAWEEAREKFKPSEKVPEFKEPKPPIFAEAEPAIYAAKSEPEDSDGFRFISEEISAIPAMLAAQDEALNNQTLADSISSALDDLTDDQKVDVWPLKTSVKSALKANELSVAKAMVNKFIFPENTKTLKAKILALFPS